MRIILSVCLYLVFFIGLAQDKLTQENIHFTIKHPDEKTSKTVYLFVHGIGANLHQSNILLQQDPQQRWILKKPLATFNFQDIASTEELHKTKFSRKEVCLGQEEDLKRFKYALDTLMGLFPDYEIVLVGVSRGASVILTYLGSEMFHEKNSLQKIKAVVLESPFDDLSSIIKHLLNRYKISWLPFSKELAHKICKKYFPKIDQKGIFPKHVVHNVPQHIPIILIHSKKDYVVPIKSSRWLYNSLKTHGNKDVYIVELLSGHHGKLLQGQDQDLYFYTVQAFYKKYGLPHDKDAAERGAFFLEKCRPDMLRDKKNVEYDFDDDDDVVEYGDEIDQEDD
jgi:predicted esterase